MGNSVLAVEEFEHVSLNLYHDPTEDLQSIVPISSICRSSYHRLLSLSCVFGWQYDIWYLRMLSLSCCQTRFSMREIPASVVLLQASSCIGISQRSGARVALTSKIKEVRRIRKDDDLAQS